MVLIVRLAWRLLSAVAVLSRVSSHCYGQSQLSYLLSGPIRDCCWSLGYLAAEVWQFCGFLECDQCQQEACITASLCGKGKVRNF